MVDNRKRIIDVLSPEFSFRELKDRDKFLVSFGVKVNHAVWNKLGVSVCIQDQLATLREDIVNLINGKIERLNGIEVAENKGENPQ